MLERLTLEPDFKAMYASGELQLLYYTFISPIMPRSSYLLLQEHIRVILDGLDHRQQLPRFVDVPELYRPDIIRVLRQCSKKCPRSILHSDCASKQSKVAIEMLCRGRAGESWRRCQEAAGSRMHSIAKPAF